MFEFRYKKKDVPTPEVGPGTYTTMLVLQYRYTLWPQMIASGDIVLSSKAGKSDWNDVEIVP